MKNDNRTAYVTRDAIMKLLSDDEVARVSTAETAESLADGDEFVDLEDLDQGVLWARGSTTPATGRLLPRKAVEQATWTKILARLAAPPAVTARSGF